MKIVIAPDSFKESLDAKSVAQAIYEGFSQVIPDAQYHLVPLADGGEGTISAFLNTNKGQKLSSIVQDPLGRKHKVFYALIDKNTAVIEVAEAIGLSLLSADERNPFKTSSFGVGEMILAAAKHKVKHIIVGLGGSSTNDGGLGMLAALGVKFFDKNENILTASPENLLQIDSIDTNDLSPLIKSCRITVACDVQNPLLGPEGASYIFGPQKGATTEMVKVLDQSLKHYAHVFENSGYEDLKNSPGVGAAGGLAYALALVLKAELVSGVDVLLDYLNFEALIQDADLIITGEGKIDQQTFYGKTLAGVTQLAKQVNVPVIGIGAVVDQQIKDPEDLGMLAVFPIINEVLTLEKAIQKTEGNIKRTALQIAKLWKKCSSQ